MGLPEMLGISGAVARWNVHRRSGVSQDCAAEVGGLSPPSPDLLKTFKVVVVVT